jgi:ribonucleoside-triphosphate reductase
LEASPAESTSYRLALHDRKQYPQIIASGGNTPYYTNSTQLPVDFSADIFDALDHQEVLQQQYTGGTVFHTLLGEEITDWRTCRNLVKTIASRYRIPYFTISPVFSVCAEHGYLNGRQESCPQCGAITEVYSRIVGYYRSLANWNAGKRAEFDDRLHFSLSEESAASGIPSVPSKLANLNSPPVSYLLFHRTACPQCPPLKARASSLSLQGTLVDTDQAEGFDLAREHGISSTPTLVVLDSMGAELKRIHGVQEWPELEAMLGPW